MFALIALWADFVQYDHKNHEGPSVLLHVYLLTHTPTACAHSEYVTYYFADLTVIKTETTWWFSFQEVSLQNSAQHPLPISMLSVRKAFSFTVINNRLVVILFIVVLLTVKDNACLCKKNHFPF